MADNLLFFVLFAILFMWALMPDSSGVSPLSKVFSVNVVVNQPTPQVSVGVPTPVVIKPNLCEVAAPYFAAGMGCAGAFNCVASDVSCVGNPAVIDCGTPMAIAGANQCSALGAQWHCDAHNVWCRYV